MPLRIGIRVFNRLLRDFHSSRLSRQIDGGGGKIRLLDHRARVSITKERGGQLIVRGELGFNTHLGRREKTVLHLDEDSVIQFDGNMRLGDGIAVVAYNKSHIRFGGDATETKSGITSDTRIMAARRIEIGKDFLCAWGVVITDCDWHGVKNQPCQENVVIGDHVWTGHGVSILKGSVIPPGSIVAAHAVVTRAFDAPQSLLAGVPASVIRTGVQWQREMPPLD